MKTKEELNQLKLEYESLNSKLKELSDDELKEVIGGVNLYSYVSVPNVIGLKFEEAKTALGSYNLTFEAKYERKDGEKDIVLLCDPLPGTIVSVGTKIVLVLSSN